MQQATKFEMVLNRKTAKMLGIEISSTLLATADDVIDEVAAASPLSCAGLPSSLKLRRPHIDKPGEALA